MHNKIIFCFLLSVLVIGSLAGCKKWDDVERVSDENVTLNLFERISSNPDLSKFAGLLTKSGYAGVIASSKTYTVFAPDNAALASLSASIENDTAALKKFVGSHIANQSYYTSAITNSVRIGMLNGKYHNLSANAVDGVAIATKDQVAKNGVFHIIGTALPALNNLWEFIATDPLMPAMQKLAFDSSASAFRSRVYNLANESRNYTLFVLQDAAWQTEMNKFKPYFVTGNADSTTNLTGWTLIKDLVFDTLYADAASLPDTLVSKFNVKVGVDKSAITQTINTSNGVVYVMSSLPVTPRAKFPDIIVEAENYTSASANRLANTYLRDKIDSATGKIFRDILVYGHGLPQFNLRYRLTEMPSLKYRAYWMALNDNINGMTVPFSQKISIDSFNSPTPAYVVVPLNRYAEQLAGEFTLTQYRPTFNLFLTAANNTTANSNALVCNYIRLEPQF